jgi:5-methylcytosine-specific restriction protein B
MGPATETQDEGFFRQFCKEAAKRSGPCVLILDEINRIDVASVFGELLYMLEYRDIGFALSNPHPIDIPTNV